MGSHGAERASARGWRSPEAEAATLWPHRRHCDSLPRERSGWRSLNGGGAWSAVVAWPPPGRMSRIAEGERSPHPARCSPAKLSGNSCRECCVHEIWGVSTWLAGGRAASPSTRPRTQAVVGARVLERRLSGSLYAPGTTALSRSNRDLRRGSERRLEASRPVEAAACRRRGNGGGSGRGCRTDRREQPLRARATTATTGAGTLVGRSRAQSRGCLRQSAARSMPWNS